MFIKKLGIVIFLVAFTICCSGCSKGENNDHGLTDNVTTLEQYSENVQKTRAIVVEDISNRSIGEILDNALIDCSWSEYQDYLSKTAKGCVQVSGKDKKSGEDVNIIWGIEMVDQNEQNHFENMSKGREIFLDYECFKTYISEYR